MNMPTNDTRVSRDDDFATHRVAATAAATIAPLKLLYWSVRRELWENRSLYLGPPLVAGVLLFAVVANAIYDGGKADHLINSAIALDPTREAAVFGSLTIGSLSAITAMMLIITVFIVGALYCLDALNGERRDRSILFWKSLPVSDLITVLSKAAIPLVVLPLVALASIVGMHLCMLVFTSAVQLLYGQSGALPWTRAPFFQNALVLLYGLATLALWHAPIYAWLLLVSSWAKRSVLLWAVLPPLVLAAIEGITLGKSYFASLLAHRLGGSPADVFPFKMIDSKGGISPQISSLSELDPLTFLTMPALWGGLAFAAACIAAAVWLRRRREPI